MVLIHNRRPKSCYVGIRVNAGGNAYIGIAHCPWCGSKLGMEEEFVGKRMVEAE